MFESKGNPGRIGHQTGFAPLAEELREIMGVRKSALKRDGDLTYYSKLHNGHRVPGWGEEQVVRVEANRLNEISPVNRGRNEIKNYIKTLLQKSSTTIQNREEQGMLSAQKVIELANRLLEAAEYLPLSPERPDDGYLLDLIQRKYPSEAGPASLSEELETVGTELKTILSRQIERLVEEARLKYSEGATRTGKAEIVLFKTGVPRSEWHQRISTVENRLEGSRLYYGSYLTVFATPPGVREEFTRKEGWNTSQTQLYLSSRQERQAVWQNQLGRHLHRDLYDMESLGQELKERKFRSLTLSKEQMEERVRRVCAYLDQFDNFEIGLSRHKLNFHFQVKAEQVVLMEGRRMYPVPADFYSYLYGIQFNGPEYVSRFKELFYELWQDAMTDKRQVQAWLKEQVGIR
ncbi:MAG TPA: hypothetical protein VH186_01565 [Chloroflexia bacterium]|nr:hypothetical protein [Chloroflexia bacterium]